MKILLLAYENDFNSYIQVGKQLKNLGHEVAIFSADFFSVTIANNYTQIAFQENGFEEHMLGSLQDELKEINKIVNEDTIEVDYEYLAKFESKLKGNRTLNNLIALDYIITQFGHSRTYVNRPKNKEITYKTLELCLKKADTFFEKIKPDLVFTYGNNHIIKNIFYEISLFNNTPMLALDTCRVNNRYILLDNLWIGTSEYIKKEMQRLKDEKNSCEEANAYIENMIKNNVQAYNFEGSYDLQNDKKYNFTYQLKPVLRSFISLPRATLNDFLDSRKRGVKNNYYSPISPLNVFLYNLRAVFRIKKYFSSKDLNNECPSSPYVFVPLHMIPENNIFTDPELIDELELIRQVSRSVPVHFKVVIKANPSMLVRFADTHPSSFYEKMNELPNVVVVSPKLKSMPIISKAKALVTISGTGLLEAAILGIPAFSFGHPEFSAIDGVVPFEKELFKKALKDPSIVNNREQKYYIQAVLNNSVDLEFSKYYMASKEVAESKEYSEKFTKKVVNLILDSYKKRY